jgi:hypothetical protein
LGEVSDRGNQFANGLDHGSFRFTGQRSAIHPDHAMVGHDVRLGAALDGPDIHRGVAQQWVLLP